MLLSSVRYGFCVDGARERWKWKSVVCVFVFLFVSVRVSEWVYATFEHAIQFRVCCFEVSAWKFNQYLMCDRRCLQQTPSSLTNEYVALLFENEHTITTYGENDWEWHESWFRKMLYAACNMHWTCTKITRMHACVCDSQAKLLRHWIMDVSTW